MDTIVRLSGDQLVATHYGFYNTVVGTGILLGNLCTGTVFDLARAAGWPRLPEPASPCSAPPAPSDCTGCTAPGRKWLVRALQ